MFSSCDNINDFFLVKPKMLGYAMQIESIAAAAAAAVQSPSFGEICLI